MFEIEALKAKHGDCLLLHWGTSDAPRLAIIDGGPNTIYAKSLKPRLAQLEVDGAVRVDLMMLSHIDDDHINGLIDLCQAIDENSSPVTIDLVWFNSLEGLLNDDLPTNPGGVTASVQPGFPKTDCEKKPWEEKVLASVPQGQALDALIKRLGLNATRNDPYQPLVMRGGEPRAADVQGLKLTVVAPKKDAVEALRKVWRKYRHDGVTAAYDDDSPYNLSSIVVVAEFDGKSMLLTGDALGLEILNGLEELNWPKTDGRLHFDVFKLPHHGSQNNVTQEFFEQITADHYVVSGDDVKFPNPHINAMHWLAAARGDEPYTISCTYEIDYMATIFGARLLTPASDKLGVSVKLA